ncbi:MAG: Mur ligase family protein [Patescibacteria group bacterium]
MHYHLIGSMGVSMRGIQKILEHEGHVVTGSDLKLKGHDAKNISSDIDVIVRTSAVSPGSPGWVEVLEGEKLGIKIVKRSEILADITKKKYLITISGMHGKTTVTSLIGLIMIEAGFDPTVLVGEEVREFGDVVRIGKSKYFVMEACEYDRSFLDFKPDIAVITNIDKEHLDTYPGGVPEILDAFGEFIKNIKSGGILVYCAEDQNLSQLVNKYENAKKVPYKISGNEFEIGLLGEHNKLNSEAAISVGKELGIKLDIARSVLKKFKGAHRRLEYKGSINGAQVYDDYGHHPTEIRATIKALSDQFPDKKLVVVFWPHQYKRILPLLSEFADAFKLADDVILKPIYFVPGRDEELDVSSEKIVEIINTKGKKAKVFDNDDEICDYLINNTDSSSIILTIGIPPIYKVAEKIVKEK